MKKEVGSDIVTEIKDLKDQVNCIQKSLATLRLDIVDQLYDLLTRRSKEERIRRRERCW